MIQKQQQKLAQWQAWLVENKKLNDRILQRNNGQPIDVDTIWEASRADIEERHDWLYIKEQSDSGLLMENC